MSLTRSKAIQLFGHDLHEAGRTAGAELAAAGESVARPSLGGDQESI
jgi:hypothetical protein